MFQAFEPSLGATEITKVQNNAQSFFLIYGKQITELSTIQGRNSVFQVQNKIPPEIFVQHKRAPTLTYSILMNTKWKTDEKNAEDRSISIGLFKQYFWSHVGRHHKLFSDSAIHHRILTTKAQPLNYKIIYRLKYMSGIIFVRVTRLSF